MASASTPSAPPAYPSLSDDEAAEPLVGYPAVPVDGHPVYGYPPPFLPYHRRRRLCRCRGCSWQRLGRICGCLCCSLLIFIAIVAFFVWPRSLGVSVDDISLGKIHFQIKREGSLVPSVYLNLTIDMKLEVENPNYFDVTYETVIVSIYYKDDEIGEVESHGGDIGAQSTSSVDATLELNSNQIASNVLSLLVDVYNDAVPLQAVTTFDGHLNVFWFKIPLEGDVTCNMVIDPDDQVVVSKSCSV
ncbi:hypothetical protein GOP47_0030408 [Adiantum capillus-veneris]|nr:hypothetical protein GOP47_0030408 [Adiantum capillus-veneris]